MEGSLPSSNEYIAFPPYLSDLNYDTGEFILIFETKNITPAWVFYTTYRNRFRVKMYFSTVNNIANQKWTKWCLKQSLKIQVIPSCWKHIIPFQTLLFNIARKFQNESCINRFFSQKMFRFPLIRVKHINTSRNTFF